MPLDHVLWLGGPPAAGKTTVARRLARRHGLRLYEADTRTWGHRDRALAAGVPAAHRWERMPRQERWDPAADAEDVLAMSLHAERGPMVVEDLRALPRAPIVLAEGSVLPASAAAADAGRALWLLPTEAFQDARLADRTTAPGPARLHRLLRDVVEREATAHALPTLTVDGTTDPDGTTDRVEQAFSAALAAGPRATSPDERRTLLREANLAVVHQVRSYHVRPWAPGAPEQVTQRFVCECGTPTCTAEPFRTVAEAARGPVLAH